MEEASKKKQRRYWTTATELALLQLWEEKINEIKKTRNYQAYAEIANTIGRYTPKEVRVKVCNFTQRYRNERKHFELSGEPSSWKYFDHVARIVAKSKANNIEPVTVSLLCEDNQSRFSDCSALPSRSTSSSASISTPPLQAVPISPKIKVSTSPPPPVALSPVPESISGCSTSRRAKRKMANSLSLQKDVLKISKENQAILREQTAFSQNTAKEQLALAKRSLQLLEESTQNSKYFATKIVEISEQQLDLEKDFMKIMKKVIKKIDLKS